MQDGWIALSLAGLPFPITVRPPVRLSDEELQVFCERNDLLRVELGPNGDLTVKTPAGPGSGKLNSYLIFYIVGWAEADESGEPFDSNTGFTLADGAMRSPDAAWMSHARIAKLKRSEKRGFWRACPEVVAELISKSDSRATVEEKMEMWMSNGAELAWLISA